MEGHQYFIKTHRGRCQHPRLPPPKGRHKLGMHSPMVPGELMCPTDTPSCLPDHEWTQDSGQHRPFRPSWALCAQMTKQGAPSSPAPVPCVTCAGSHGAGRGCSWHRGPALSPSDPSRPGATWLPWAASLSPSPSMEPCGQEHCQDTGPGLSPRSCRSPCWPLPDQSRPLPGL